MATFLGGGAADAAFAASMLTRQLLHGTVSLRITRAVFRWPPLGETGAAGINLILDDVATGQRGK